MTRFASQRTNLIQPDELDREVSRLNVRLLKASAAHAVALVCWFLLSEQYRQTNWVEDYERYGTVYEAFLIALVIYTLVVWVVLADAAWRRLRLMYKSSR